ncbi:MAG: T9SS type A sorting domain-containing protein, partial [bacterium]
LPSVTSIAQDTRPGKTHIWYYGTGEIIGSTRAPGAPYRGDGIFKSIDGGITWTKLPSTATNLPHIFDQAFDYVWDVIINPANTTQDEVFAATFSEIKRSVNGGASWQTVLGDFDSQSGAFFTEISVTPSGIFYATMSQMTVFQDITPSNTQGLYRSENGINWTEITPPGWPNRYNRTVIGIAPSDENIVYFLSNTPGSGKNDHQIWKYTYLSGDGSGSGGVWENRTSNLPGTDSTDVIDNFDSQHSYDLVIGVKPNNPDIVFIGGTNLYRSSDGFASSSRIRWIGGYNAFRRNFSLYPSHHPDQHAIVFLPSNPNVMYSSHDGGVSRTDNNTLQSVSWTSLNNGYLTTQFFTVTIDPASNGSNLVIGGMQDNGTWSTSSTNTAANWNAELSGDGAFCATTENGSVLIASAQIGQIFRIPLEEFVTTFARLDPAVLSDRDYLFINPFTLDANNSSILYLAGGKSVWRNSNIMDIPQGSDKTDVNWDELTNTRLPNAQNTKVSALVISTSPANMLYYGTTSGEVYKLQDAHTGQPAPVNITSPLFPNPGNIGAIAVDPTDANNIMIVFSNYGVQSIFFSNTGGDTWQAVGGNLEENSNGAGAGPSVRWADILPQGENTHFFVGTSIGLYSTTQLNGASTTWALEGANTIGNSVVDMVVTRAADGQVVAATHGRGIFSSNITTPVREIESETPAEFVLLPNYPNPFNPSTNIRFVLPNTAHVSIKIYDTLGRHLRTLVDEPLSAGVHSRMWDGRDKTNSALASGVYFVHMQAGVFSDVRKVALTK